MFSGDADELPVLSLSKDASDCSTFKRLEVCVLQGVVLYLIDKKKQALFFPHLQISDNAAGMYRHAHFCLCIL